MIRPISPSRAVRLKEYEKIKREWRKDPANQRCCVPGCKRPADKNPHHPFGRILTRNGDLLLAIQWYKPICWPHHTRIKDDPKWAYELGLLGKPYNTWPKDEPKPE